MPQTECPYADIEPACELINTRTGVAFGVHGRRNFVRTFQVKTTNPLHGPNEICQANNLPTPFEGYDAHDINDLDRLAVCISLEAKLHPESEDDNRFWWIVTANYSTETPPEGIPDLTLYGSSLEGSQNNPWEEPPLIRWESETIQRAYATDLNGVPFLNSAKQPFSPPPTFEFSRRIMVLIRNQRTFDIEVVRDYDWAVNSDLFMGIYIPGRVQCFPINAEMVSRGSLSFWRVTYRLRFASLVWDPVLGEMDWESFQPKILDAGMCTLASDPLAPNFEYPVPILKRGFPTSQPVLLDGTGQELNPVTDNPVYLEFEVYKSMPFADILTTGIG